MTRDETIKGLCDADIGTFLSTVTACDEGELEHICQTCQGPAAEAARDALAMRQRIEQRRCETTGKLLEFGGQGTNQR